MQRDQMVDFVRYSPDIWDIVIIGGGATGLGIAIDSASRGFKTLLLEQSDFAKATSSRSTKLIHGGLRYLKQGHFGLVKEALEERGRLCKNAPHLVDHLPFLIPTYSWWESLYYGAGLFLYDMLAGNLGIEKSKKISKEEIKTSISNLESGNLYGGRIYYDGQFDDARLAITLMQTAYQQGAILLNYCQVTKLVKDNNQITGVIAHDLESDHSFEIHAKAVINATGIFTDEIRRMDDPKASSLVYPSQGIHLVLPKKFLDSDKAILIPRTDDKRVIFIIPWHNRVLLGTTDIEDRKAELEPKPLKEEIDFLLEHAQRYLVMVPTKEDIKSVFAGLRPLVKKGGDKPSGKISRNHYITFSDSGLVTICGGKWTTYRKMAEDVVNKVIDNKGLRRRNCITADLPLYGYQKEVTEVDAWSAYGSNADKLSQMVKENPGLGYPLHPDLFYLPVEVIWAVKEEMARTLEDVLSRRTRALFLDAKASIEIAPKVAKIMAQELNKDQKWIEEEVKKFRSLAQNYLV